MTNCRRRTLFRPRYQPAWRHGGSPGNVKLAGQTINGLGRVSDKVRRTPPCRLPGRRRLAARASDGDPSSHRSGVSSSQQASRSKPNGHIAYRLAPIRNPPTMRSDSLLARDGPPTAPTAKAPTDTSKTTPSTIFGNVPRMILPAFGGYGLNAILPGDVRAWVSSNRCSHLTRPHQPASASLRPQTSRKRCSRRPDHGRRQACQA